MIKISTITPLIEMFGVCPMTNDPSSDFKDVLTDGLKKGYVVSPTCLNKYSKSFINSITMKYNSTFYQTWGDVTNKTRFEQFVDQIVHYFMAGSGLEYIPNVEPNEPEWTTYKLISGCTFDELYTKCMNMLSSGIALKSDSVRYITTYVIEYCKVFNETPDVDSIKNREAMVILCDSLGVLPKDGAKLFAHIVYKATGLTMIVKNRELRKLIRRKAGTVDKLFMSLNKEQKIALAGVYNRYKELFIAFKTQFSRSTINKIGHLSKKYHKPMKRGFWETVLFTEPTVHQVRLWSENAAKASNYKLVQVMQSIRERMLLAAQEGDNMYVIRNGKVFVKDNDYTAIDPRYYWWDELYDVLKEQLIKNLSAKACKVKFPTEFTLTCPTSEKNFIGNVPMGTSCSLGKDSVLGIYWQNDWGTKDFDLSYEDINGCRIGWNSRFCDYDDKIVFSGDIVNAPNGANEVIRFVGDVPNGIVYVNRYNGDPGSKYRMFFGTANQEEYENMPFDNGYCMVDPNKVSLEAEITQGEMNQQMVGLIDEGKFVFYALSSGYSQIARAVTMRGYKKQLLPTQAMTADAVKILRRKTKMFIPLKEILLAAGFKHSDKEFDIDLTQLNRDTLINLFDKE